MRSMFKFGGREKDSPDPARKSEVVAAGDNSPANAVSQGEEPLKNLNLRGSGYSVAELVCYFHREGATVEDISDEVGWGAEEIKELVLEAKSQGLYDKLANEVAKKQK